VPAHNLQEFIAYAKANSGKLSYGHAGIDSTNHLTGELFKMLAGTPELVQVPYRGMGPAMTDLISGQLAMVVPAVTGQVLEFHRSAVTSPKRLSGAPELPTAAEGGLPGLTVTAILGLLAPARTPAPIVEQIAQATRKALADPAYQQMLIETGFEPILDSAPENSGSPLPPMLRSGRPSSRHSAPRLTERISDACRSANAGILHAKAHSQLVSHCLRNGIARWRSSQDGSDAQSLARSNKSAGGAKATKRQQKRHPHSRLWQAERPWPHPM